MARLQASKYNITTDASGNATSNESFAMFGLLYAVEVVIGTLASGAVDITLTVQNTGSGTARTLLTLTNVSSSGWYFPRFAASDPNGTALTATAGGDGVLPVISGTVRVAVAQGGNAATGNVTIYYTDGV
jgi:uncharacterized membrane protein AbrB (regulator of aidB expression)